MELLSIIFAAEQTGRDQLSAVCQIRLGGSSLPVTQSVGT